MAEQRPLAPGGPGRTPGGFWTGLLIGTLSGIGVSLGVAIWLNLHGSPFNQREAPVELPAVREFGLVDQDNPPAMPATDDPADAGEVPAAEQAPPGESRERRDARAAGAAPRASLAPPRITLPVGLFLQAGAFRDPAEADDRKAHLALLGLTASVQRVETAAGQLHRVRVGPFGTPAELDRARQSLNKNGIESFPMRPDAPSSP